MGIQQLYSIIKPVIKIKPSELGYITKESGIVFQSHEAAMKYGKCKVVEALKAPKPFEREVCVYKNKVISQTDGTNATVKIDVPDNYTKDVISMHGHPDYQGVGETLPLSSCDVGMFERLSEIKKIIVFNSRGEYSAMTKKANFPPPRFIEETHTLWGRDVDSLAFKISKEFEELGPLGREAKSEYVKIVEEALYTSERAKIQEILESGHMGNYYDFLDRMPELIKDKKAFSKKIHELWQNLCSKWRIEYSTNFSDLK